MAAPNHKFSNLMLRFKMGMARRVVGRKSAKILAKLFVGDQGVEVLNKLYEFCRILVGGNPKAANDFIDRSFRILTDVLMFTLERKFTETEKLNFVSRINDEISQYNRLFEVIEGSSPGFNTGEIPQFESQHQKVFKKVSDRFICDMTKIFIETLGHHFDAPLIRCIHKISNQLRTDPALNQLCYNRSPAYLQLADAVRTANQIGLELSQRRLKSNFQVLRNEVPTVVSPK